MSRIALAWRSDSPKRSCKRVFAVSVSGDALISSHDFIDRVDRDLETFQDMLTIQRMLQLELGASNHHDVTVLDEVPDQSPSDP